MRWQHRPSTASYRGFTDRIDLGSVGGYGNLPLQRAAARMERLSPITNAPRRDWVTRLGDTIPMSFSGAQGVHKEPARAHEPG